MAPQGDKKMKIEGNNQFSTMDRMPISNDGDLSKKSPWKKISKVAAAILVPQLYLDDLLEEFDADAPVGYARVSAIVKDDDDVLGDDRAKNKETRELKKNNQASTKTHQGEKCGNGSRANVYNFVEHRTTSTQQKEKLQPNVTAREGGCSESAKNKDLLIDMSESSQLDTSPTQISETDIFSYFDGISISSSSIIEKAGASGNNLSIDLNENTREEQLLIDFGDQSFMNSYMPEQANTVGKESLLIDL